jgi:hypothetical protein
MQVGDTVKIYNMTMSGNKILEGTAKLVKPVYTNEARPDAKEELWMERFTGDPDTTFMRWVEEADQK